MFPSKYKTRLICSTARRFPPIIPHLTTLNRTISQDYCSAQQIRTSQEGLPGGPPHEITVIRWLALGTVLYRAECGFRHQLPLYPVMAICKVSVCVLTSSRERCCLRMAKSVRVDDDDNAGFVHVLLGRFTRWSFLELDFAFQERS